MNIVTLIFAHLIVDGGGTVPYLLLPKFTNNETGEYFVSELDYRFTDVCICDLLGRKGLSNSVNKSMDPCNNFYGYSCSNWMSKTKKPEHEPFWNHWQSVNKKILDRIETILKSQHFTQNHLIKAQDMYKACISNKIPEIKYISSLRAFIDDFGGWPIINPSWNASNYNWTGNIASITRILGIHPLLKMHVFIDLYNTSQHIFYVRIERGELILPQAILVNSQKYRHYIKAYLVWILETIRYLFPNQVPPNELEMEVTKMVNFEIQLAKLHFYKDKSEKITLNKLYKQIPIKWDEIFKKLFNDTPVNISLDNKVIIRNRRYLMKLLRLMSKTKTKTVANYLIWSIIKTLSRDTTNYMRSLSFMMDNVIFGIKKDISRTEECLKSVITYMDLALIPKYSNLFLSSDILTEASNMTESIKLEFIRLLRQNSWLNNKTKYLAIEKINSLEYVVGFPEWLNNNSLLEEIFDKVNISNNHFTNMLQLRSLKMKNSFEKLQQPVRFEWPGSLFDVNAYYSILQNTIFIPVGMLERPFFTINRSRALNYGALGSLIGHEISHSLDVLGRHADKNGNIKNWWLERDIVNYEEAIDCFKNQYNEYNTNGVITVGENIADNVGLQISYNAFKNLKMKSNLRITEFSTEQIFFTSFSQVWCEITTESELINEEAYAPVKIRVQGTLQNIKSFNKAFYCKNEQDICTLW